MSSDVFGPMDPPKIPAIETEYRGVRFRSRLEARWAHYFTTLGLPYLYEHEGYELPSGRYLPDFWIASLGRTGTFLEIKPDCVPTIEEQTSCIELADVTRRRVMLFAGAPGRWIADHFATDAGLVFWPDYTSDVQHVFCLCEVCGAVGIGYQGRSDQVCKGTECSGRDVNSLTYDAPKLVEAARLANTNRFWDPRGQS